MNVQVIENLATALGEGYPAWIICSIVGYVIIMKAIFPGIFIKEEDVGDPEEGKVYVHLEDPEQIKLDKILRFLAASVCVITLSAIFSKIVLFLLGLILAFLAGFIYLGVGIVVVFVGVILFIIVF